MTREEILQDLKNMLDELVEPCEDCISRQAALNCVTFNEVRHRMVDDIKALPSVTPKYSDEEIDKAQAVEQAYVDKMAELRVDSVLDKIRAEIEREYSKFRDMSDKWCERANGLGTALEIIDKYKAESED